MKGCLKELRRLKKHYENEHQDMYFIGIIDGIDMAIDIIKNKEFYGD